MRVDKLTLSALEATLRLYQEPERALKEIPVLAMLSAAPDQLDARANAVALTLREHGMLGLGLAPVVPIAFSAAGNLDPRATGRLVGRVATIGYVGSVAGPIMIGWLAEATSLRTSLGRVVVLALPSPFPPAAVE